MQINYGFQWHPAWRRWKLRKWHSGPFQVTDQRWRTEVLEYLKENGMLPPQPVVPMAVGYMYDQEETL